MDLSRLQASAKQAIIALTSSEQELVRCTQLRSSLGPQQLQALSTLALLKLISEVVSRDRLMTIVQACVPRFDCSWKLNTAVGKALFSWQPNVREMGLLRHAGR